MKAPIALAAAALTLALAACTPDQPAPPAASATETTPTATTDTPTPIETSYTPTVGDAVTADQLEAVTSAGLAAYEYTDGTLVVVDPHQDLPDTVKSDIASRTNGAGSVSVAQSTDAEVRTQAVNDYYKASMAASTVGKTLVAIQHAASIDANNVAHDKGYAYVVIGAAPDRVNHVSPTKAGAFALAEAWVAAQADPTAHVIVDATGD